MATSQRFRKNNNKSCKKMVGGDTAKAKRQEAAAKKKLAEMKAEPHTAGHTLGQKSALGNIINKTKEAIDDANDAITKAEIKMRMVEESSNGNKTKREEEAHKLMETAKHLKKAAEYRIEIADLATARIGDRTDWKFEKRITKAQRDANQRAGRKWYPVESAVQWELL